MPTQLGCFGDGSFLASLIAQWLQMCVSSLDGKQKMTANKSFQGGSGPVKWRQYSGLVAL